MGNLQRMTDREPASLSVYEPMTLRPASLDCFNLELLACLTLSAPAGMSDEHRIEWLKVARDTIGDLPEDLLKAGCVEARKKADHPAKIVPIIMATVEGAMKARRSMQPASRIPPERRIEPHYVQPGEAAKILESLGLDVPDVLRPKASGMEARRGETAGLDAQHDSPARSAGDAQTLPPHNR